MESPVCMPTGSKFSMLHMVMTLPAPSRITSNSISFQPAMHFSTRICPMGERRSPFTATSRISSSLLTAAAAQRKGGTDYEGIANFTGKGQGVLKGGYYS